MLDRYKEALTTVNAAKMPKDSLHMKSMRSIYSRSPYLKQNSCSASECISEKGQGIYDLRRGKSHTRTNKTVQRALRDTPRAVERYIQAIRIRGHLLRYGGSINRLKDIKKSLGEYLSGESDSIPSWRRSNIPLQEDSTHTDFSPHLQFSEKYSQIQKQLPRDPGQLFFLK